MLANDRENYEKFFNAFGRQLKYGVSADYGMHKEELQDLLMYYSSTEKKLVTLSEYVDRMKEDRSLFTLQSARTFLQLTISRRQNFCVQRLRNPLLYRRN